MNINTKAPTPYGMVDATVDVLYTADGQVILHIASALGTIKHTHRVTVGADDGVDLVATLNEAQLTTALQTLLDAKRAEGAAIVAGRAKVAKIAPLLI